MNTDMKRLMAETIRDFRLPRYHELPNMGLYLEQTVKYLNQSLAPLGFQDVTAYMVSNYVKKRLIPKPEKKQYYAPHIAYLFFVAFAKNLISMENIALFIRIQQKSYTVSTAYDYLCTEMENVLLSFCGQGAPMFDQREDEPMEKKLLRNFVWALAHTIQMNLLFSDIRPEYENAAPPASAKEKA